MPKFAFLTRQLPHPAAEELNAHGYTCLEALQIDEGLHLLEHEDSGRVLTGVYWKRPPRNSKNSLIFLANLYASRKMPLWTCIG